MTSDEPDHDAPPGPGHEGRHDFLILGAGPGGLQLAHGLEQAGADYRVLEASPSVGAFFRRLPRGRRLISFNKVHSLYEDEETRLRWDWNSLLSDDPALRFREFSQELYPHADDLVRYLEAFAERGGLAIQTDTRVVAIERAPDGGFLLTDQRGRRLACRVLVLATGFSRPYEPAIPGLELCQGYEDVPLEPEAFTGQRVLILGKGNSALEIADVALERSALVHVASPTPIQLAWKTRHPGHLRAEHTRLLDLYQLKTLNGALDCRIQAIALRDDGAFAVDVSYVHADGETERLVYDRVVRCTGFRVDLSPFAEAVRPATVLDGRLPAITGLWESTNVPDLFFAGTLMQALDFKRSSSAFIDGFRYNVRTLNHHLLERYLGRPFPSETLPAEAAALRVDLLARACRTSALWTQFGYLCDLYELQDDGSLRCRRELPLRHVEQALDAVPLAFTLTFEWGPWDGDVFAIERHPRASTAHTNVFLHPIVRRWSHGRVTAEHHVLEDLFGTYTAASEPGAVALRGGRDLETYHREEHEIPLERFLAEQLARPRAADEDGRSSGEA